MGWTPAAQSKSLGCQLFGGRRPGHGYSCRLAGESDNLKQAAPSRRSKLPLLQVPVPGVTPVALPRLQALLRELRRIQQQYNM